MIIIDFGIICIGQAVETVPKNIGDIRVEVFNRKNKSEPMYSGRYDFHTADTLSGNWYLIWLSEDLFYEQSFFDMIEKDGCAWIYVEPKWKDTVRKILEFYIQESPFHKIAVLLREQDESNNVSHPACSLDEFMNCLVKGNIRWNELYYIDDNC